MPPRVHVLQHVPYEGPGHIGWWATQQAHKLTGTAFFDRWELPDLDEIDLLVVLGGPMSVHEEEAHSWLVDEKAYLKQAIEEQVHVLGICLGAQLLADVLGGEVHGAKTREIGWFPVERTPGASEESPLSMVPKAFEAFHWHSETFSLPQGATRLASSPVCENQAFSYGDHVLGLQFHLEIDPAAITQLAYHCHEDLADGPYVQEVPEMVEPPDRFRTAHQRMRAILDAWAAPT